MGRLGSTVIGSLPSVGITKSLPEARAFCSPTGSEDPEFGGDRPSGFRVRAATVAGLSAGSVAKLAFNRSLGASSSRRIFFGCSELVSERRDSSESRRLHSEPVDLLDSVSFGEDVPSSLSALAGLLSRLFDPCRRAFDSS